MNKCGPYFLLNLFVTLSKERATFRMSHEHIAASKIAQHGARHFTGEGAVALPMEILSCETDLRGRA